MFILDVVNECSGGLANIIVIMKRFMDILMILAPIILILFGIVQFIKMVNNPDDKKNWGKVKNMLNALVMVFIIPVLVNTVMNLLGENYTISACWNNASLSSTVGEESSYNDNTNNDNQSIVIDPDDYDPATGKGPSHDTGDTTTTSSTVGDGTYIFIGDSRTVQMKSHVGDNSDIWSCKGSMGLDWMKSTGIPNITANIKSHSKIVILMGVNDLYQVNAYISYINEKASEWNNLGASVYFVSVNPCDGSYSHLNSQITSFNSEIKNGLNSNITYLDSNSYLYSVGFSTTDGLHYDQATSKKIYNYIKSKI